MQRHNNVLFRLSLFARPYWRQTLLALVFVVSSSAFVLTLPVLLRWAIDTGLSHQDKRLLVIIGLAVVATAMGRGLFAYGQQFMAEWIAQRIAYDIRNKIYNHLQSLSFAYHDKAQTGQIMSRATQDVEGVGLFGAMGVIRLVYIAILLVGAVILMLWTNIT